VLDGMTYTDYVEPVGLAYAQGAKDRNDILRPEFHRIMEKHGGITQDALDEFYGDDFGMFARVIAYESGGENCVRNAFNAAGTASVEEGIGMAATLAYNAFSSGKRYVFEHGCGMYRDALTVQRFMHNKARVVTYDYDIPFRRLFLDALWQLHPELWVTSHFIRPNSLRDYVDKLDHPIYHLVVSNEVLEHVLDPAAEVALLIRMLKPGGFLMMSTFFNSCEGKDPQHLEAHVPYQDSELWFRTVEAFGVERYAQDPRGVYKVWRKL